MTSEVYDSQGFILGPRVDAFEKAVSAYVGSAHAIGMSSGTDAQLAVMMALGIGPGDDVVTSPYTFFASAGAVARLGARPVFVDIEPETFNFDPAKLERALTRKTKLIQPVHLYGQCADMDPVRDVAKTQRDPRPRGRLSVPWRGVRRRQGRRTRGLLRVLVLPVQESRRLRRRRDGHDERRRPRDAAPRDANARRDEPLPPQVRRRKLPPRRASGGRPPREAAVPRRLGRGPAKERAGDRARSTSSRMASRSRRAG